MAAVAHTPKRGRGRKVLALSELARTLNAGALGRLTGPLDTLRLPKRAGTMALGAGAGSVRYLAVRVEAAGPEIGGLLVATPIAQAALGPAQLLRSMFTESPDLMCIADLEGRFLRVSPSWTELLGWSEQELLSRPFEWFVHPQDRSGTDAERFLQSSGCRWLAKPFRLRDLLRLARETLR